MDETDRSIGKILIAEFFGTLLVAFATSFTQLDVSEDLKTKNFRNFFGIYIAIVLMRNISCSYFNPAIFIMFCKLKNFKFYRHFLSYIIIQCFGALAGYAIFNYLTFGSLFFISKIDTQTIPNCIVGEFISSFVFYLAIISTFDPDSQLGNNYAISSFSIVAGIGAGSALGSNLSGSNMNPAIGFGAYFSNFLNSGNSKFLVLSLIYIFVPITASLSVASFYVHLVKGGQNPYLIKVADSSFFNEKPHKIESLEVINFSRP